MQMTLQHQLQRSHQMLPCLFLYFAHSVSSLLKLMAAAAVARKSFVGGRQQSYLSFEIFTAVSLVYTSAPASVVGKRYCITKCDTKYHFCKAKSTLYRQLVRINFVYIKNVTKSAIDTDEADKKGKITSPLRLPFQCPVGLYCLLSV